MLNCTDCASLTEESPQLCPRHQNDYLNGGWQRRGFSPRSYVHLSVVHAPPHLIPKELSGGTSRSQRMYQVCTRLKLHSLGDDHPIAAEEADQWWDLISSRGSSHQEIAVLVGGYVAWGCTPEGYRRYVHLGRSPYSVAMWQHLDVDPVQAVRFRARRGTYSSKDVASWQNYLSYRVEVSAAKDLCDVDPSELVDWFMEGWNVARAIQWMALDVTLEQANLLWDLCSVFTPVSENRIHYARQLVRNSDTVDLAIAWSRDFGEALRRLHRYDRPTCDHQTIGSLVQSGMPADLAIKWLVTAKAV